MAEDDFNFGNRGNVPTSSKYKINALAPNFKKKKYNQKLKTEKETEKQKEIENKKYFLYDFKKHGCGLFTQKELTARFRINWTNIRVHYLNKSNRIGGFYYIRSEKF